jgi:hypothetical protein
MPPFPRSDLSVKSMVAIVTSSSRAEADGAGACLPVGRSGFVCTPDAKCDAKRSRSPLRRLAPPTRRRRPKKLPPASRSPTSPSAPPKPHERPIKASRRAADVAVDCVAWARTRNATLFRTSKSRPPYVRSTPTRAAPTRAPRSASRCRSGERSRPRATLVDDDAAVTTTRAHMRIVCTSISNARSCGCEATSASRHFAPRLVITGSWSSASWQKRTLMTPS